MLFLFLEIKIKIVPHKRHTMRNFIEIDLHASEDEKVYMMRACGVVWCMPSKEPFNFCSNGKRHSI